MKFVQNIQHFHRIVHLQLNHQDQASDSLPCTIQINSNRLFMNNNHFNQWIITDNLSADIEHVPN